MDLELVRVEGPSWVEMMTYHADPLDPDPTVYRRISSQLDDWEGRTHHMHMNRYHMHLTWVFGKPGTYDMVFKMHGKRTNGEKIESEETSIIWQVGPTP